MNVNQILSTLCLEKLPRTQPHPISEWKQHSHYFQCCLYTTRILSIVCVKRMGIYNADILKEIAKIAQVSKLHQI